MCCGHEGATACSNYCRYVEATVITSSDLIVPATMVLSLVCCGHEGATACLSYCGYVEATVIPSMRCGCNWIGNVSDSDIIISLIRK